MQLHSVAAGLVNASCRVVRDGANYNLRVAAAGGDDLGLDREWECRVLRQASAAGLAPPIRECLPRQGILVSDWSTGRAWSLEEIGQDVAVDAMAVLLRRVHALSIPQPARVMTAADWISHYSAAAARRGHMPSAAAVNLRDAAEIRMRDLTDLEPVTHVLCHSDLHRLNLLIDGADASAVLLDWEYAHVADGLWDVAGWAANNDWSTEQGCRLLECYLQRTPEFREVRRLELLGWLYDYVCLLWSDIYVGQRPGQESAAVTLRAERLAARLSVEGRSRAG